MPIANYLEEALNTGVKFYASLTREQAKGNVKIGDDERGNPVFVEPGAICFVSDSKGNSIFLDNRLFGDGAVASGTTGGGSGTGGGGLTEVNLGDIVVIQKDGEVLKTLADYFGANGEVITDSLIITTQKENALGELEQAVAIELNSEGIKINGSPVITQADLNSSLSNYKAEILEAANTTAQNKADQALSDAKDYTDSVVQSVYKVKGSVQRYDDLAKINNPSNGDVYNVIGAQGNKGSNNYVPPGTNYVYIKDGVNSYWDPLGGTIDLSGMATSTDVVNAASDAVSSAKDYTDSQVGGINTTLEAHSGSINTLSEGISTLNTTVLGHTTQLSNNTTNIETNTNNITNIATQLTWQ